jgi:hypothetical protein
MMRRASNLTPGLAAVTAPEWGGPPEYRPEGAPRFMSLTMAVMAAAMLLTNPIDWLILRGDFWRIRALSCVSNTPGVRIIAPLMLAFSGEARREIRGWSRCHARFGEGVRQAVDGAARWSRRVAVKG